MLGKISMAAAAAVTLVCATPAVAATTISFGGGNSSTDGTDGNVRSFSNGGISVQASGWSYDGSTLEKAFLGWYGNGLGVTNNSEGNGGSNTHAVDNLGQRDFILLVFNQSVNIASGVLHPYSQNGDPLDNDAAVSYTNVAGLFTNPVTNISTANPLFSALGSNLWNVTGNTSSPFSVNFSSTGRFGNVWLIGASTANRDQIADGFKLTSINVTPAVPEPGTWAMMLLGFGAVGYAMRRKRPALLPQAA